MVMRFIRANIKWIVPFLGAIAAGIRPYFVGSQHFGQADALYVGALVLAGLLNFVIPNVESEYPRFKAARYANAIVVIALAGIGAAQKVLPGGFSRADVWEIATALVTVALTYVLPTTTARAVHASGPGRMGDHLNAA